MERSSLDPGATVETIIQRPRKALSVLINHKQTTGNLPGVFFFKVMSLALMLIIIIIIMMHEDNEIHIVFNDETLIKSTEKLLILSKPNRGGKKERRGWRKREREGEEIF